MAVLAVLTQRCIEDFGSKYTLKVTDLMLRCRRLCRPTPVEVKDQTDIRSEAAEYTLVAPGHGRAKQLQIVRSGVQLTEHSKHIQSRLVYAKLWICATPKELFPHGKPTKSENSQL